MNKPNATPFFVELEEEIQEHARQKSAILKRFDNQNLLKAWNGFDRLVSEIFLQEKRMPESVIDDSYGALSLGWEITPQIFVDSEWSKNVICLNSVPRENCNVSHKNFSSFSDIAQKCSLENVIWKCPKSLVLCEWILSQIPVGAEFWVGGMDKYLPSSFLNLFKECGTVHVYLGQYKAHVYKVKKEKVVAEPKKNIYPSPYDSLPIESLPGVFSAAKLDMASRLLIDTFKTTPAQRVLDFGSGCGILGFSWKAKNPDAEITFCDDSQMAIESSKINAKVRMVQAKYLQAFQLDMSARKYNLIISNPPFHKGTDLDVSLAFHLIRQMHSALEVGGELWFVIPISFKCQKELNKLFSTVTEASQDKKNIVFICVK